MTVFEEGHTAHSPDTTKTFPKGRKNGAPDAVYYFSKRRRRRSSRHEDQASLLSETAPRSDDILGEDEVQPLSLASLGFRV